MTRRIVILAVALLAACAEADATATASDSWSTQRASAELVRAAERILATDIEAPSGWTHGVVLAEDEDGTRTKWAVLTDEGPIVVDLSWNCGGDDGDVDEGDIHLIIDPGDLIAWSPDGSDATVCSGELEVLKKAAIDDPDTLEAE